LAAKSFQLTYPLIWYISESIEQGNLYSPTLQSLKIQFESNNFSKKFPNFEIFNILSVRVLMNSVNVTNIYSNSDPICVLLYTVIEELLDNGLLTWLNITTEMDPILRTVEFAVEKKIFLDWVVDIFDCAYLESNMKVQRLKMVNNNTLYGPKGLYAVEFGRFRAIAMKIKQNEIRSKLEILTPFKKRRKIKRTDIPHQFYYQTVILNKMKSYPGVTSEKFKPLTEDTQEEFDDGYSMDPDVLEFCEFDPNPDLPKYGWTESFYLSKNNVTGVRGGAWNMFIGTQIFDRSSWEVHGFKKLYRLNHISHNPYDCFTQQSNFIFYVGIENFKGEVKGYTELSWEQSLHYGKTGNFGENTIEIQNVKYTKKKVFSTPRLVNQITKLDSYFKRMTVESLENQISEIEEKIEFVEETFKIPEDLKMEQRKLKNQIDKFREKQAESMVSKTPRKKNPNTKKKVNSGKRKSKEEEKITEDIKVISLPVVESSLEVEEEHKTEEITNEKLSFEEMLLKNINKIFEKYKSGLNMNLMQDKQKTLFGMESNLALYSFKKPLIAMTDLRYRAEFETIFPGMWDPFINNELCINKNVLFDKLDLARVRISRMPPHMRDKFRKLLLIVSMVLHSIRQNTRMDLKSYELTTMVDDLFRVNMDPDIEGVTVYYDLEPGEIIEIPFEFNFL
jgi:hypothetical protein